MQPTRRHLFYLFLLTYSVSIVYVYIFIKLDRIRPLFLTGSNRNIATVLTGIYYNNNGLKREGNYEYPTANNSRTKPPYYPFNGTGQTVNIWSDFDVGRFNDFCEMDKDLVAVIPVYSAPGNFERRKAMRETVGKTCSKLRCKMFFIVGVSLDTTIYTKVKDEHSSMRDILIIDKVDTYRDLNNKAVAMLDWLIEYCRKPKYVIHIIDDFYPNLQMIIDKLNTVNRTKFVLGCVQRIPPIRNNGSKWFVSKDEYPNTTYPPYPIGVIYAFRNDECAYLRRSVHAVEYCWVEDSWFMGHVRLGAGLETVKLKWYLRKFNAKQNLTNIWKLHSGIHQIKADNFYEIYNHTVLTYKCTFVER